MDMLKGDIESGQGMTTTVLPDDLVVDILSRLPLKSFCRSKCICKSWLAFSSDPHYRQKIPRTPSDLLYQRHDLDTVIHLARLPSSDRGIDTTLSFVPCDEYPLELNGCSNGVLLSYRNGNTIAEITNAIVCNPATEEWLALPYTPPGPTVTYSYLRLCFDPLWSQHFYVFNFQKNYFGKLQYKTEVEVFFSENSTWSSCLWKSENPCWSIALFVNGVLYVANTSSHDLFALDAPETCTELLNERTIQLPGFDGLDHGFGCWNGCLSQSGGVLCYAQEELDGCMMRIWSLEGSSRWVMKHRLSINNILGRDIMLRTNNYGSWYFEYDILAFDLERELVILVDRIVDDNVRTSSPSKGKVLAFSISTGKLSEIWTDFEPCLGYYYMPCYSKFPASALRMAQDEC